MAEYGIFHQQYFMTKTSEIFSNLVASQRPLQSTDFADFAGRIAAMTEAMLAEGKLDTFVAIDGLERLRADMIVKGARPLDVEPITRLLSKLP